MSTEATSQLDLAKGLVQLLTAHPDLPHAMWTVHDRLRGDIYGPQEDNFTALRACLRQLGGTVRRGSVYETLGERMRSYVITTAWGDIPVEVSVSIPADLHDPELLDGLLADRRHDVTDPAVPVEQQAVAK
ncbi:hypothetical protein I5Q34_01205 [Streptomyces sp. AV19]|uniref:hypothetical protein n=1 Tax=Streptomyces sp. AV19 TaxID=2793068 RepID=UPI0018FED908|nr:hypothetical protein [Streptomyces sp. AV19]MBH1932922.1 hypothetical protein [Streptomyces sp. AV19]MDG4531672.1 hypothetical protein [Streptomyces sp. AV19]